MENATITGTARAAQHPGPTTCAAIAALTILTVVKCPRSIASTAVTAVSSYAFTDLYLNVLHMFLDHERNQEHRFATIRALASSFQEHHGDTTYTFHGNHMLDIDPLITSSVAVLLGWHALAALCGRELPRCLFLWTLLVCLLGELAIYNHSLMHARTHGLAIPRWSAVLQDVGMLVPAPFHRVHHTTFDANFAFLVGLSPLYDALYHRCPTYTVLHVLFWLAQPHTIISFFAGRSLMRRSAPRAATKRE